MREVSYGYSREFKGVSFDDVVAKTTEALGAGGFGVLTEIDVTATMKKKLDVEFRNYRILGACNPPIAHQALSRDPGIGLLLPCNVTVFEEDDGTVNVTVVKPSAMFQIVESEDVEPLVAEVEAAVAKVLGRLDEMGASGGSSAG